MPEMLIPRKLLPFAQKPKRFKIAIGGRGCISADTIIDTPSGRVRVDEFKGGEVYCASELGITTSFAERPIRYKPTEIFKVSLSDGSSIKCTSEHRFLTSRGWQPLSFVRSERLQICVSCLPQKHSELYLLESHEDAQHCFQKLLGFLYCYCVYHHLCGQQPLPELDTYLDVAQLLADEQQHNLHALTCEDGQEFLSTHSPLQLLSLLSNLAFLLESEERSYEGAGSCNSEKSSELISEIRIAAQQFLERNNPALLAHRLAELFLDFGTYQICWGKSQKTISDILLLFVDGMTYSDSLSCNHDLHYIDVLDVQPVGVQCFYDLFVPIFNNYLSSGIVNHNSGKSMTIADLCLMDAQTKGIKTGCFREFQNSIEDSVHSLLTEEVERLGLEGFDCQQSKILYNGEEAFKFRGLARNVESVKSMHGFQRFWIEEGATISFDSLKALTPTLRTEDSEIWISANPKSSADPFSQRFIKPFEKELLKNGYYEDDLHLIVWINYNDNPLFPEVLEQERAFDEKNLSRALYNHIWLGHFYDEVDNSLISVDWFDAAIDAHKKLGFKGEGAIVAAFDPSDEGADSKGYALRHGSVVLDVAELTTGDSADGVDWALDKAISSGADWFAWDCDGLGIALKREVEKGLQGKKIDYFMFRGSQEPENPNESYEPTDDNKKRKTNKETFLNRRAQYYWRLRDKFFNTYKAVVKGEYVNPDDMISLSSDIECLDQLRAEVCRIPLKRNNNGKIQIMSKLEMSKKPYELPSPNMADSLMMSCYVPSVDNAPVSINFEGWQ